MFLRYLFRGARFAAMVAPMALVDPRFGIIVVAGCAAGAALWTGGVSQQEARAQDRIEACRPG